MLPPPMNVRSHDYPPVLLARSEDRGADAHFASRPPRSPARDRPTCPSTACRRRAPPRGSASKHARSCRNCARSRSMSPVGSGMPMMPRRRRLGSAATWRASAERLARAATPLLRRLAAHVDLHADIERRPAGAARSRQPLGDLARGRRSRPSRSMPPRRAPCCSAAGRSGATRCPGRSASASRLGRAPPARSSRRTRAGRAACTARIASAGNVLETASSRTDRGGRPARARRPRRCAAARLATPSRSGP